MEKLKKIFYDDLGGISLTSLIKKGAKLDIPASQVREFYAKQTVNQINRSRTWLYKRLR